MSQLLHTADREVKKILSKREQLNNTRTVRVYLDWGRDGQEDLRLLTSIRKLSKTIADELCNNKIGG